MARSLLVAHALLEGGTLADAVAERYTGWDSALGGAIMDGEHTLESLHALVMDDGLQPQPVSGRQEALENLVNREIERAR